ncbi:MAG: ABC transporter ATP-binding protein/permease [Saprospiraceae bacterium]|nr:ABC transporter ATP-binding protein/permease [Saprospiraceae bacterium]MDP4701332.1 ABC transporter ATP-binding protein/permease [Saprospiraceae bacterium]MDP4812489.1 ABC transporter ATP-binding protein/permease [Saprospiraceae bacterium]MDP4815183.1 ABC transporter ATP-binding protein/permease [Saprospiraceae bacterium]MDP4915372.1 ABC transporter ATP-binding protein/permease [Saprospiraceae bacterium]
MNHLYVLNHFFWKYRWHFLGGIFFVSLSNYFRVLQPQAIREALDLVIHNVSLYRNFEGSKLQQSLETILGKQLLIFGLFVLLFAGLMGLFMYFMRQTIIVMSRLIEYDMRKEIFEHYQILDLAFYKRNKTGDLMARITEDVNKVRMYLGPAILYGINLVSLFAFVIYAMVNVSLELTLFCLIPLPILSISIYYVSDLIHKKSEEIQQQLAVLNNTAQEVYAGIRVVKAYTQENSMLGFFTSQSQQYNQQSVSLARINALFYPLMILLIGISTLITVYAGGTLVVNGSISTGNIAEFVIYVNMLTWPVTSIGWIASIIQQASASQKRINEFMQTKPSILSGNTEDFKLKGDIVFNNVGLTYPDTGICALKNIQLHIKAGEKIAIIGKTGSGKSSFAELLLRMNDVSEGEILFDGVPVKDLDLGRLREQIGYVPQDVFLFSDSLKQNITFGKPDASDAEIEKAIFDASLTDEIKTFPDGLNTILGERGITLSGGQKQRVSIARALLKNPEILILDDCLSAVDSHTENKILHYFQSSLKDKTAIIISHRIYMNLNFDKILVFQDGEIAHSGTHEELLKISPYYLDLYERQLSDERMD